MRKRFCPKCGEKITQGTLCENCLQKDIRYEIPLIQVSEFNRVFESGRWKVFENLDDVIRKRVLELLGEKHLEVEIEPYEFDPKPKEKILITVNVKKDGVQLHLPVKISYMQCDFGQKEKTGYFEGVLQLRNPTPETHDFIKRDLEKVSHKGVFITKTVPIKNGVDLYFTNKNHMRLLAQRVHNAFGGTIKINSRLFSHNHETSKDIFRVNIFVELPEFVKGDVISYINTTARNQDESRQYVYITGLGRLIQAKHLLSGKQVAFELKYVKDLRKEEIHKTKIISLDEDFLVLHPITFQAETVVNKDVLTREFSLDEDVFIILSDKGALLIECL
jgi:NMD protein affecting ribosome stability and mRNA decay